MQKLLPKVISTARLYNFNNNYKNKPKNFMKKTTQLKSILTLRKT